MTWERLVKSRGKSAHLLPSITIQYDKSIYLSAALGFKEKRTIDILFDTSTNKLALIDLGDEEGSRGISKSGYRGLAIRALPIIKLFRLSSGQRFIGIKETVNNKDAWVFDLSKPE